MKRLTHHPLPRQFLRFAAVGAISTVAHFAVLLWLRRHFAISAALASTGGFVAGAVVNYALNYRYTFNSNARHHEAFMKFMTVALIGLGLNAGIMHLLADRWGLADLVAQAISTGLVLFWSFTGNRAFTFREARS
jgi:putative flippase GtrA